MAGRTCSVRIRKEWIVGELLELLSQTSFILFTGSIIYMILSLERWSKLPPFDWKQANAAERKDEKRRENRFNIKLLALMASVLIVSWLAFFWLILVPAAIAIAIGVDARSEVKKAGLGPTSWLLDVWKIRHPMLIFDIWTIGVPAFIGVLFLILRF